MSHSVETMIVLKYLPPRCKVFRIAYRMHESGLTNMIADAQQLHERTQATYWKIQRESVDSGAILATLASGTQNTITNISPLIKEKVAA